METATSAALLPWRALGPGVASGLVENSIVSHVLLVGVLSWSAAAVFVSLLDDDDDDLEYRKARMEPLSPELLILYSVPSTKAAVD